MAAVAVVLICMTIPLVMFAVTDDGGVGFWSDADADGEVDVDAVARIDIVDKYNPKLNEKKTGQFFRFFSELKECTRIDYINLPAIVCSNKVKCNKENQGFFRYMIGLKPKECFCSGKLKYDCGNEYCVANKIVCGDLFESNKNSTFLSKKIKNCI